MTVNVIVMMGVSGSGKSTVGALLAARLGWPYADADAFHSAANIAKMAAGHALTDADRVPWLRSIRAWIDKRLAKSEHGVVSCSALKRSYRDVLRGPEIQFVYLHGSRAQLEQRLGARQGHFFKSNLLDSQLAALEEPTDGERVMTVEIDAAPHEIVDAILSALES